MLAGINDTIKIGHSVKSNTVSSTFVLKSINPVSKSRCSVNAKDDIIAEIK